MTSTFVFLHLGTDPSLPTSLVRSIRRHISDAYIIQCTDSVSIAISGVDKVARLNIDSSKIMLARLQAFSGLGLDKPALYLDTDMLMLRPFDPAALLSNGATTAVCRRSFQRDVLFNHRMRGLDFSEYEGKTLDQVFPIIACATVTANPEFWEDCLYALEIMDEKYHIWYGDQEAMKVVAESPNHHISHIPEKLYGCLPEIIDPSIDPFLLHFKGPKRKALFGEWQKRLNF